MEKIFEKITDVETVKDLWECYPALMAELYMDMFIDRAVQIHRVEDDLRRFLGDRLADLAEKKIASIGDNSEIIDKCRIILHHCMSIPGVIPDDSEIEDFEEGE